MTSPLRALTDVGYQLLLEIAKDQPELFRRKDPADLKEEMRRRQKNRPDPASSLFDHSRLAQPQQPLGALAEKAVKGPSRDREHAEYLWHALPTVSAADMSDPRVLAAINCFHLQGRYVNTRWGLGPLGKSDKPEKATKFVSLHWLGNSKESNTAARLWWLCEFSRRAGAPRYSKYPTEVLLYELSSNVNFYHQMLRRTYLMASDRVRGTVIDVSLHDGLLRRNNTTATSRMLSALNRKAGAISLDVLSDKDLRRHVEGVMPPKADASHHHPH